MYDFLLELEKVSIWGVLPLLINTIFVIAIITVSSMKKDKISPVDELCDKRKNHKLQKIFLRVDLFSEVYLLVCSILACIPFVTLFMLPSAVPLPPPQDVSSWQRSPVRRGFLIHSPDLPRASPERYG